MARIMLLISKNLTQKREGLLIFSFFTAFSLRLSNLICVAIRFVKFLPISATCYGSFHVFILRKERLTKLHLILLCE